MCNRVRAVPIGQNKKSKKEKREKDKDRSSKSSNKANKKAGKTEYRMNEEGNIEAVFIED
eukprot:3514708-Pyramimonas_sp.AAC.2